MNNIKKAFFILAAGMTCSVPAFAQDKILHPDISYAGTPRSCIIGGINISGIEGYEDYMLTGISGLQVGQEITVPGTEITNAVKRYWRHGLFSDVQISADSIVGRKIYLHIALKTRPRVSVINYEGLKKSEREDMEKKLGLLKGSQITPNMIDRAKILAKKYFDDKGFKNAEITINQRDDVASKGNVILDVIVDKKEKMKVRSIIIEGNKALTSSKIKGGLFKKGAFAKIHEAGKLSSFLKAKKFTPERWATDKKNLIEKYNEYGYRDATLLKDSVWNVDPKHVDIYVKIDEGQKYYLRNITWVGNTVYSTLQLNSILGMKKGDVYNQKLLDKRVSKDEDAAANLYYNHGYVFSSINPTEVNIDGDSIDLEMRVTEGPQAYLSHVRINGNTRLYENVIRRELRTKPGDLFSREALMRSLREIQSMGHFDPEKSSQPDVKPNPEDGTVDINYNLEQKSNDQIEFSLGWGQTGVIGKIGLKLNNFSMANLFRKNKEHRGIMPIGDGEVLSLSAQTNGSYYQSYNASYSTNWFGGKRPNQFSVGFYFSKMTDVSSSYYNDAVDFDGDGRIDLWYSPADAIGSIANYLQVRGWQKDGRYKYRLSTEPSLPAFDNNHKPHYQIHTLLTDSNLKNDIDLIKEIGDNGTETVGSLVVDASEQEKAWWITYNNFYVITRYNASPLYAMAVGELADRIRHKRESKLR